MIHAIMFLIPTDAWTVNISYFDFHKPGNAWNPLCRKLHFDDIPACILSIPH